MSVPPEQPPVYPPPARQVDQPTAPLDPVAPRQVPPRAYREDPYVDPRREAWRFEGLRTALTIVGLLALAAIGLAVWALIRSDHNQRVVSRGGSNAALVGLTSRVDRLQAKVDSLHSPGAAGGAGTAATVRSLSQRVAALEAAQKQLNSNQKQLTSKLGSGAASTAQVTQLANKEAALSAKVTQWVGKEAALSGQVSSLQGRVGQLAGQVRQLQSQSGLNTATTGTTTGP